MSDTGIAKIFMAAARTCACRWLSVCRATACAYVGSKKGILLEPMATDMDTWFAELDRFANVPFMEDGRRQRPMPATTDLFD